MGTSPSATSPSIPGTNNIVSPYGRDIDTSIAGTVRYTRFSTTDFQLSTVSEFIEDETRDLFTGTRMMIAEWSGVAEYNGNFVSLTPSLLHFFDLDPLVCTLQLIYEALLHYLIYAMT